MAIVDNYIQGIENICSYMKRGALDYCDAELKYLKQVKNAEAITTIGGIKSRILRDWGQAADQLKMLVQILVSGGEIIPLGNSYGTHSDTAGKGKATPVA